MQCLVLEHQPVPLPERSNPKDELAKLRGSLDDTRDKLDKN